MEKIKCSCGLNPNEYQSIDQQKWEIDHIKKHGICSACKQEKENNI